MQQQESEYIVPSLDPEIVARICAEADSWIGTRFLHQGKIKGLGVDCAQFIAALVRVGVGIEVDLQDNYRRHEDGLVMVEKLSRYGVYVPTNQVQPADMMALCDEAQKQKDKPRHLVLVREITHTTFIIHASEHGVRRHRINQWWRGRIHSCWRPKAAWQTDRP